MSDQPRCAVAIALGKAAVGSAEWAFSVRVMDRAGVRMDESHGSELVLSSLDQAREAICIFHDGQPDQILTTFRAQTRVVDGSDCT